MKHLANKSVARGRTSVSKPIAKHSFADRHFQSLLMSILSVAGVLYAVLNSEFRTGIYNDDALYVLTSKDFWNTIVRHPLLEIKPDYPMPGLPLLLAPFTKIIAPRWFYLEWVSVAATLLSVFFLAKWLRAWLNSEKALLISALYALNPLVVRFSGIVMPATYFAFAAITSSHLLHELIRNPSRKTALLLGFVVGWAGTLHPDGILIAIGTIAVLVLSKTNRRLLGAFCLPMAGWAIFLYLWFHHRTISRTEYGSDILNLLHFWSHNISPAFTFTYQWFQATVFTSWSSLQYLSPVAQKALAPILLLAFVFTMVLATHRLWNHHRAHRIVVGNFATFTFLFFAVHVFWHIPDARYAVPILPFLCIATVCAFFRFSWGRALLGVVLVASLFENAHVVYKALYVPNPLNAPPWFSLEWVRQNTDPQARVVSNVAPSVDLYSNRAAGPLLNVTSVDMMKYVLLSRGYDYILLRKGTATASTIDGTENLNLVWNRYRRWAENYPNRFPTVFIGPSGTARVYAISPDPRFLEAYELFIEAGRLAKENKYEAAFSKTSLALKKDPTLPSAMNLLGALYFIADKLEAAENIFKKTIELQPDSPNGAANLATLYSTRNNPEEAQRWLALAQKTNLANGNEHELAEKIANLPQRWKLNDRPLFIDFYSVNE